MTKTINATKGELVTIINGLFGVQELKGKDFSLVVSKNISTLKDKLKDLEDAGAPDPKFLEVAQKVNEIANKNEPDAKDQINKIEEENKELVEARRSQMAKVEEMMKEKVKVKLDIISEEVLPEDISAAQINKIIKIIK
tara:strand:+ start:1457 stop:1873 length:417 start_codon:yes stop_codon:yes gene_type:complete